VTLPLPLVIASGNHDKVREIIEIFAAMFDVSPTAMAVTYASDTFAYLLDEPERIAETARTVPVLDGIPDVEETGTTFEANARIKATALGFMGIPSIADDSGLAVDALDGAPGVYSARYAGTGDAADNIAKLLRELDDRGDRTARFVTVALAVWPDGREVVVRGEVEGHITRAPRGAGGFGYDPVFEPVDGDGRTFAEMAPAEKHAVSHRGRAFRALAEIFDGEGNG